jgi:hypothetical protein
MSLELIGARETADGIEVTFVTERGIEPLEGTCDEIARLATVMQQVSALAMLNESERVWIDEVAVGDAIVKLGLNPGRQGRVKIIRREATLLDSNHAVGTVDHDPRQGGRTRPRAAAHPCGQAPGRRRARRAGP